jgi:glycine/D-amino acid oxidase-like deaminating enzyme
MVPKRIHIVGQGLAGTLLAFQLEEGGFDVSMSDDGHQSSSSMVAAGMWNPVSFKKLSFSWNAPQLISEATEMYLALEKKLGVHFFHPTELVRVFADSREANLWDEKSDNPEMEKYLSSKQDKELNQTTIAPSGHGIVLQAGWLDIPTFLLAAKSYFIDRKILNIHSVDLKERSSEIHHTIYCTGYKAIAVPGFEHLPIRPNKGQVLTVSSDGLNQQRMLNFGKFVVPLGNNTYRLGATYEFDDPNPEPTESTQKELLLAWNKTIQVPCTILEHKAGYRPTVSDRKPIVGLLPDHASVGIFGGFGSKGVMLIPRYAKQFAAFLTNGQPLDAEVRLERFLKK